MEEVLNVMALCAGIGGLELGLRIAMGGRARGVCYVEREAYSAACLVARMEDKTLDPAPIWSDLATFDARAWRGAVDVITSGIPCQPFSVAGKRTGTDDQRWLWNDVRRIIDDSGAWGLFLENVPGLLRYGLPIILSDLAERGWSAEWGYYSAREVGAPHLRRRLFVLAVADSHRERFQEYRFSDVSSEAGSEHGYDTDRCSGETVAEGFFVPGREPSLWTGLPTESQPAVCRGAHGLPSWLVDRADRLRALGNGVVPLAAAYAFRDLTSRLAGKEES